MCCAARTPSAAQDPAPGHRAVPGSALRGQAGIWSTWRVAGSRAHSCTGLKESLKPCSSPLLSGLNPCRKSREFGLHFPVALTPTINSHSLKIHTLGQNNRTRRLWNAVSEPRQGSSLASHLGMATAVGCSWAGHREQVKPCCWINQDQL